MESPFKSEENVAYLQGVAGQWFPHPPSKTMVRTAQNEALWFYGVPFMQGSINQLGIPPAGSASLSPTNDKEALNQRTLEILHRDMDSARKYENWYNHMLNTPIGDRLNEYPRMSQGSRRLTEGSARLLP